MWDKIASVVEEEAWTYDYVREVISSMPTPPPSIQKLGNTRTSWHETEPGIAFIRTIGGTVDDRRLAENLLKVQLEACGYKQAQFTLPERIRRIALAMISSHDATFSMLVNVN